jgi:hypothetical protein
MGYSTYDKRIPPRIYPWWLILVGFAFGVIATLIFTAPRWQPTVVYPYDDSDRSRWLEAPPAPGEMGDHVYILPESQIDPLLATATAFIHEATLAARNGALIAPADPIALTATAIVAQATQMAPVSR